MNFEDFKEKVNIKSWEGEISEQILNNCYDVLCGDKSQWYLYFEEPIYIIGLSEDKYDYYWLAINNKEKRLQFITCVYKLIPCDYVDKKFNKTECNNIINEVKKYFKEHSVKENLLWLDEKLFLNK